MSEGSDEIEMTEIKGTTCNKGPQRVRPWPPGSSNIFVFDRKL